MKLKNKVGMAYDICLENRKKFYIHLLAAFIFYSILIFLIYLIVDAYSYEYRINKSIKCGIDRLGYVSVPIDAKYSEKIYSEISQIGEIDNIGCISDGVGNSAPALQFLLDIQSGHKNSKDKTDYAIETTVMNIGIWPVMNINLVEGKEPYDVDIEDNNKDIILYLSEKYCDIVSVGDVFEDCDVEGNVIYRYTVGGFFDEKSSLMDPHVFDDLTLVKSGSYSMEYGIIELVQWENYGGSFFTYSKENDYDNIVSKINGISEKYDTEIDIYKISSVVGYTKENTDMQTRVLKIALGLFGIAMMISLSVSQIYSIITKSRDYGIRLSNGVTKKDMCSIIFMQNIIQTVIPVILSMTAMYFVLRIFFGGDLTSEQLIKHIFTLYCVPISLVVTIIVVMMSSVIPAKLMKKTSVLNLLNGRITE